MKDNSKTSNFIGISEAAQSIKSLVAQVAPSDISVLITGESGTGKEVVARMIHEHSPRKNKPIITVNCGAIPEGIFESEVFGHEKGSFTGADKQRKGYFELADGGTIFLDEIGEMPLPSQVKILRILETGDFMRVGGTSTVHVNVRVVAATNRDLANAVSHGEFRSDLYFRLKAVNIFIPPLRERKEDIPLLVEYFVNDFCVRNNIQNPHFTSDGMQMLKNHYWEGNVRELKNYIESIVTLGRGGIIDQDKIRQFLGNQQSQGSFLPMTLAKSQEQMERELIYRSLLELRKDVWELKGMVKEMQSFSTTMEVHPGSLEELEKEQIRRTLEEYNGNRRLTAKALGIGERTLYRKLNEYGLN